MLRRALLLIAFAAGCGSDSPTLSSTASLIGKCSFGEIDYMRIEPGEIFLYATFDPANNSYAVVTGEAQHAESLTDHAVIQDLEPVYSASRMGGQLEFGDDKWIGIGNANGEVHSGGGETYGTEHVYPSCAYWSE